jgi:Tol biopolymer transport system component/tRNA A-37 threonylcarbamoyl transferase component Bud32
LTDSGSARLAASSRLGPYEIVSAVGAGGMGEVYSARDTRLDRTVAIKLLPPQLARDEQLRARFEREAKPVSALNHPHICTLHDVGRETVGGDELHYLVLEMIEGESLADRLSKGPLPLAEVLRYGVEIASALDAAHRQGIVHRDLKPGNVMLTKTGAKLLDFGLAHSAADASAAGVLSTLKTLDKPLTEAGTILGTFQYMSPEQLEGQPADARTDIFALGALLYEMATGRRAFSGESRTSLIAAIVSSQPPAVSSVQAMSPPALDHVIRKCLEKDPEDRWQSARDVVAELKWIAEGGSRVGLPAVVLGRRRVRERLAWAAFAVATLAAAVLAVAWARRAPRPPALVRFSVALPEQATSVGPPAVSPDGSKIAFDASDAGGKREIWLRALDELEARPLAGSEGALRPIWSPDSRFIAFMAGSKLRKVDVAGGPPQTICDAPTGADGSWSPQGVILFDGRGNDPIWQVPAAGGVPKPEVEPDAAKGVVGAGWPAFLPDGRHFLYVVNGQSTEDRRLMVKELGAKESHELLKTGSRVVYSPPGYLLYVREQTLVAQPFDTRALRLTGEPIPLGEGLGVDPLGLASFSISGNGVLAYRAGHAEARQLLWLDRSGKETPALDEPGAYTDASLSPDGKRLAFDFSKGNQAIDIWIRDLARGVSSRFTFDAAEERDPVWAPDGRSLVYSLQRKNADLMQKDASGTREAELLLASDEDKYASDWSRDGRYLLYISRGKDTGFDLWALPMSGDKKPIPVAKTQFNELFGTFSPDGRFVTYPSNESGQMEIYVQEFPEPRNKWQVSTKGGNEPFWSGSGQEIFYRTPDATVMAVPVKTSAGSFDAGVPHALFKTRFASVTARARFRPTPDGQRFLVLAPLKQETVSPTTVVLNWTAAIR